MSGDLVFRSDIQPLNRLFAKLSLAGSVLLVAAATVGQLRADRFPSYIDLTLSAVVPPLAFAVLALVCALAARIFTIKVSPAGLRCYNTMGRYKQIAWNEIDAATPVSVYGLRYIYVSARGLSQPITVPVFLEDAVSFAQVVANYAGTSNPLSQALDAAT